MFVGTYFYNVTERGAVESHTPSPDPTKKPSYYWWYSVDGSAKIAMRVINGVVPAYGSLYVQQYLDKHNPKQFVRAIRADLRLTDGVMIFDLVHLDKYGWWKYAKEGLEGNSRCGRKVHAKRLNREGRKGHTKTAKKRTVLKSDVPFELCVPFVRRTLRVVMLFGQVIRRFSSSDGRFFR